MVVNKTELINNKARINDLLEKLKEKLRGFEVINLRGQTLGRLKDFTLDKYRRLYMIIPEWDGQDDSPVYLLSSKYIQNVDTSNQALFVDISLTKFHQLPLYRISNDKATEFSRHSPTPPVTQASPTTSDQRRDFDKTQPPNEQSFTTKNLEELGNQSLTESDDTPEVVEEQTVRLLEERLIVNRSKRKVGEIVVRKAIETRIVEVPIQSEKLIIEKVGSESQQPVEVEHLPGEEFSNDTITEFSGHSPTPPVTQASVTSSGETLDIGETQPPMGQSFTTNKREEVDNQSFTESNDAEEEIIRLLEERLIVNRSKWKVGEVVVRKEIENQIVQVPIRREKLIIEQVSPETKQIAEIDLGEREVSGVELTKVASADTVNTEVPRPDDRYTVTGEFISPKAVSNLLDAIAYNKQHGCAKVRIELVVDNPELQETYQQMFDRCAGP